MAKNDSVYPRAGMLVALLVAARAAFATNMPLALRSAIALAALAVAIDLVIWVALTLKTRNNRATTGAIIVQDATRPVVGGPPASLVQPVEEAGPHDLRKDLTPAPVVSASNVGNGVGAFIVLVVIGGATSSIYHQLPLPAGRLLVYVVMTAMICGLHAFMVPLLIFNRSIVDPGAYSIDEIRTASTTPMGGLARLTFSFVPAGRRARLVYAAIFVIAGTVAIVYGPEYSLMAELVAPMFATIFFGRIIMHYLMHARE